MAEGFGVHETLRFGCCHDRGAGKAAVADSGLDACFEAGSHDCMFLV